MYTNIVNNSLLSSKSTVSNLKELPKTYAIEVEFVPHDQHVNSYFSDSLHLLSRARGKLPMQQAAEIENESVTRLISRSKFKDNDVLVNWVRNINIEDALVYFQGSDNVNAVVSWSKLRTFLKSSLENDIKFKMNINDFYMDRSFVNIKFVFNPNSSLNTEAREMLLRLNYIPTRLVKRLINKI